MFILLHAHDIVIYLLKHIGIVKIYNTNLNNYCFTLMNFYMSRRIIFLAEKGQLRELLNK